MRLIMMLGLLLLQDACTVITYNCNTPNSCTVPPGAIRLPGSHPVKTEGQ